MADPPHIDVALTWLRCHEQEDTELPIVDNEDDEPYIVVLSIDIDDRTLDGLLGSASPPAFQLFRIGPMEDIDKGDSKPTPANHLWNLDGNPAPMPHPERTVFIVALLENDNADPGQVVNQARTLLQGTLLGAWNNAVNRKDLVERERFEFYVQSARSAFESAIDTARGFNPPSAVLDPDDKLGVPQVLRFTPDEHRQVLAHAPSRLERVLHFEGDDASYDLTFTLHHPGPAQIAQPGGRLAASAQFGIGNQTDVVFVDRNGALNVSWVIGADNWAGPVGISPSGIAPAGAAVATSPQFGVADQTDVFFIDNNGALNVSWVVGGGNWNGPVGISPVGITPAGASLATSPQFGVADQTDVFFIGANGALHVSWVVGGGNWNGPVGISSASTAPPGAAVAASPQFGVADQTDVFFIGANGALHVSWVVGGGNWAGPVAISPPGIAPPGAPVAVSPQIGIDSQTDVFFIDNSGALNVSWVVGGGIWAGPVAISPPGIAPAGAHLVTSPQFGVANQTDVFFIGANGALHVSWVVGGGNWAGPVAISPAGIAPAGAPVATSPQFGVADQTDVFFIDNNGALNVSWVVGGGNWAGPVPIA